jgi:hypothetical protein
VSLEGTAHVGHRQLPRVVLEESPFELRALEVCLDLVRCAGANASRLALACSWCLMIAEERGSWLTVQQPQWSWSAPGSLAHAHPSDDAGHGAQYRPPSAWSAPYAHLSLAVDPEAGTP